MGATSLDNEPILLAEADLQATGEAAVSAPRGWRRAMARWWSRQTTPRVEDEAISGAGLRGRPNRIVLPVVLPVLAVAALVVMREPDNTVAAISLALGAVAIVYGALAGRVEQRVEHPLRIQLVNIAVYAALISIALSCYLTIEHPRATAHWIIFLLYFLLIGATGLSDDPRQPVCAGVFSILGYGIAVSWFHASGGASASAMAAQIAPQFDWATNAARVGLLAGVTFTGAASANRGRAVRRMSLRDGLTGLLNRHAFDRCLAHLAQRAQRRDRPMTIAMIDIDHFKALNDAHGHPTGDAVLRWVGGWLQRSFRTTDVVSRYGGEEFVVAFVDTGEVGSLSARLEALRAGIEQTTLRTLGADHEIRVTVSIGIAHMPCDGAEVDAVLARADERLYAAKEAGRNRIVAGGSA